MKTCSLHYSSPTVPLQPTSPTMIPPVCGPSDKLVRITSTLFLNPAQVATVKVDMVAVMTRDNDIDHYHRELYVCIYLKQELQATFNDSVDYIGHIGTLKNDLKIANKSISIL
jgi:hypothetical protein